MSSKQNFIQPKKKVKAFKKPGLIITKKETDKKEIAKKVAIAAGIAGAGAVAGALITKGLSKKQICEPQPVKYLNAVQDITVKYSNESKKLKSDLMDLKEQNRLNDNLLRDEKTARLVVEDKLRKTEQELRDCSLKLADSKETVSALRGNIEGLKASMNRF